MRNTGRTPSVLLRWAGAILLLAGGAVRAAGGAAAAAPTPVLKVIAAHHLPASAVSFAVIDPDTGRLVAGQNVDALRSPASTIKTVTTFASLDLLGPTYQWHTHAGFAGPMNDGVLTGDLVLTGGGDPYMTLERWWSFVRMLREHGLRSIHGDIVIDNTAFALPPQDAGAFDGRPNRSYNVLPDALMVNFQSVEFRIVPNAAMHRVDVIASPLPINLSIENRLALVPGRCGALADRVDFEVASERWDRVVLSGALSETCEERSFARVLLKPTEYAFGTFVALWRELGGEFQGTLRVGPAPAGATPLLTFDSLTLGEIVRLTNKFSSNLMARHLLLTIGEDRYGRPATLEKGAAAIADWGARRALPLSGMKIDNGSGLSRDTRISVMQMARVLCAAYRSPFAPEFMASLPLAGMDGTLRSRMKNVSSGSVRLKTGHIDGVTGVAGFVTAGSGKTFVLVSLINDPRADQGAGEPVHAALVDWMQAKL